MIKCILCLALIPVLLSGALSRAEEIPTIDDAFSLIDRIISNDVAEGFPSAQLAVARNGKLICSGCWGDVTGDTLFDLASNTKMYAAAYAIQYLVAEGTLSPDTRIVDILGERFADETIAIRYTDGIEVSPEQNREWKRTLTIRDVMSHRAGFPADSRYYCADYDFGAQEICPGAVNPLYCGYDGSEETRAKTLDAICFTPLMYEPRTRILYSDVDYMLLCFVIEAVVQEPLDTWLEKTFWKPLGLTRIAFNPLEHVSCPGTVRRRS